MSGGLSRLNISVAWFLSLAALVFAPRPIPGYDVSYADMRACTADSECVASRGEKCVNSFDGCNMGICACPDGKARESPTSKCLEVRIGGSSCSMNAECPRDMACNGGVCECARGRLSQDKTFCFLPHQRLLGDECSKASNECLQKTSTSYTSHDVVCSPRGECECDEGSKEEDGSCRKLNIGETGCRSSQQCHGGALCRSNRCICPTGYMNSHQNTLCVRNTARMDVPLGASCDEMNEQAYCQEGLVCLRCPQSDSSTCASYRKSSYQERTGRFTGGSTCIISSLMTITISVAAAVLL